MRAVIQRVARANVSVNGNVVGSINKGWLALIAAEAGDAAGDVAWIADKILNLRGFSDSDGKMNLSVLDTNGAILAVSQFTLAADCRQGRRPSFSDAAPAELARGLFDAVVAALRAGSVEVPTGQFQTDMQVELVNDGPVTFLLDSRKRL